MYALFRYEDPLSTACPQDEGLNPFLKQNGELAFGRSQFVVVSNVTLALYLSDAVWSWAQVWQASEAWKNTVPRAGRDKGMGTVLKWNNLILLQVRQASEAWKNAMARAGGDKVLDDPKLLRRSLKKEVRRIFVYLLGVYYLLCV